jgi:hypothetical protein
MRVTLLGENGFTSILEEGRDEHGERGEVGQSEEYPHEPNENSVVPIECH